MNCESSRNLPTVKCDVISGKSVGCGRPGWRKGFSSPGVMKPGTSGLESVLSAQRNVLNERGRLLPEGTQEGASIRLLISTGKVFVLRRGCVHIQFPRRTRRMNHSLYYKRKNVGCILIHCLNESIQLSYLPTLNISHLRPLQMLQRPNGSAT
jgi:hypothetical protein